MSNKSKKNSIVILVDSPVLNPEGARVFPNLSVSYSIYLSTLLLSNWIEVFSDMSEQSNLVTFLHQQDEEYLPKFFFPNDAKKIFYTHELDAQLSDYLLKHSADLSTKTLVLYYNSIGLTRENIFRIFDLVQSDEPSIVIGKSSKDKIVFTCSKGIEQDLLIQILKTNRKFSEYLNYITQKDIFVHQMDNFLSIDDFEDIKKLYIELSKKESLSYCSKKMHESFNDLFIEYKELINV